MITQPYLEQLKQWPKSGRHILAQFDENSIYVYQAYRHSIADYAVEHQRFGGDFRYSRMSWIKPNFLWMMFRSGWASKEGQERILAVRIRRSFFDDLLLSSVCSTFDSRFYCSQIEWKSAVDSSDVRLQWDPDHDPFGRPVERRALQLDIRGEMLRRYGESEIISIEDITSLVDGQRKVLTNGLEELEIPRESVYVPSIDKAAIAINLDMA